MASHVTTTISTFGLLEAENVVEACPVVRTLLGYQNFEWIDPLSYRKTAIKNADPFQQVALISLKSGFCVVLGHLCGDIVLECARCLKRWEGARLRTGSWGSWMMWCHRASLKKKRPKRTTDLFGRFSKLYEGYNVFFCDIMWVINVVCIIYSYQPKNGHMPRLVHGVGVAQDASSWHLWRWYPDRPTKAFEGLGDTVTRSKVFSEQNWNEWMILRLYQIQIQSILSINIYIYSYREYLKQWLFTYNIRIYCYMQIPTSKKINPNLATICCGWYFGISIGPALNKKKHVVIGWFHLQSQGAAGHWCADHAIGSWDLCDQAKHPSRRSASGLLWRFFLCHFLFCRM